MEILDGLETTKSFQKDLRLKFTAIFFILNCTSTIFLNKIKRIFFLIDEINALTTSCEFYAN